MFPGDARRRHMLAALSTPGPIPAPAPMPIYPPCADRDTVRTYVLFQLRGPFTLKWALALV